MMGFRTILCMGAVALVSAFYAPTAALAQDQAALYWVSLRYYETRMRVGPSREYPIDWIYRRKGMPFKVLRTRDEWDLVQGPDGTQGWIAQSQLRRTRTVLVTGVELAALREEPNESAALRWRAQPGVVAGLLGCNQEWCEIDAAGRVGWVKADRLWGDEELAPNS